MSLDYETARTVTANASVVLARNPGLMTLDGTNTWILRAPGAARSIVVDPGPDHDVHLDAVLGAAGEVAAILLTHHHHDHSAGAHRLAERAHAPVLALDPGDRLGSEGLHDGQVVAAAGLEVRVWRTPGHTADSLSFLIEDEAVLTGDTILGRGTSVVAHPDGDLGDYLASLRRLQELGEVTVLPGHGPELAAAGLAATAYLDHREQRLAQVRQALATLDGDGDRDGDGDGDGDGDRSALADAVVERVYRDVDRSLWPAARLSVLAQLAYLRA